MPKKCDICGEKKPVSNFSRKQLRGATKEIEENFIKTEGGGYFTRTRKIVDKLKRVGKTYLYPEFENLNQIHHFKRKTRICYGCLNQFPLLR